MTAAAHFAVAVLARFLPQGFLRIRLPLYCAGLVWMAVSRKGCHVASACLYSICMDTVTISCLLLELSIQSAPMPCCPILVSHSSSNQRYMYVDCQLQIAPNECSRVAPHACSPKQSRSPAATLPAVTPRPSTSCFGSGSCSAAGHPPCSSMPLPSLWASVQVCCHTLRRQRLCSAAMGGWVDVAGRVWGGKGGGLLKNSHCETNQW
jgi:hypothetical protein